MGSARERVALRTADHVPQIDDARHAGHGPWCREAGDGRIVNRHGARPERVVERVKVGETAARRTASLKPAGEGRTVGDPERIGCNATADQIDSDRGDGRHPARAEGGDDLAADLKQDAAGRRRKKHSVGTLVENLGDCVGLPFVEELVGVVVGVACQHVRARLAPQRVVAGVAEEEVVTRAAEQRIVATPAGERVAPAAAVEPVFAVGPGELVGVGPG